MLLSILAFYIYDKSQTTVGVKQAVAIDSTAFKKAVQKAIEDSLKKANSAKPDTVFIYKDSVFQKPVEDSSNKSIYQDQDKSEKKKKIKIANTIAYYFNATGVNLTAISEKAGNKPQVTSFAKETDKFILSFILQNKILPTGVYTVYVVIAKPDQRVLRSNNSGNDYFLADKEGLRLYTKKIHFSYVRKSRKSITCIVNNETFSPGVYTVKIYFNGKRIGECTTTLQKGGLLE